MLKVVIAEDEILERKAMKKFLEEHFSDITVAGEAPNGRIAIEMAHQLNPDIVMMDIKMPGINGIEAIEKINQEYPAIKFIIMSAYDSFQYAKQAMNLGVKEYILKPGKKEETIKAILRVKKEILEEQKSIKSKKQSQLFAMELFLSKLLKFEVNDELYNLHQSLFPKSQSGYFFIMEGIKKEQVDLLKTWVRKHTNDTVITHADDDQCILLFISNDKQTKGALLHLARKLHMEAGEQVYIGVGFPYNKLSNLPRSYVEAVKAVKYLNKMKNRRYGFPVDTEGHDKELIENLLFEIENGNEQAALPIFTNLFNESVCNDEEQLMELFYKIKQCLEKKGVAFPDQSIYQLQSKEDWFDFIQVACSHVQHYYLSQNKMERAKKYMEENFNQPISLEEVSKCIDLSTNYFSNLFKETTGESFIDYLTRIRLNKATQYLQENKYSLKEISFKVGYKDPNYFSRVFKKHFSLSPKQYQQKILKK